MTQQSHTSVNQASSGVIRDIALESRMLEIRESRESGVTAENHHDWHAQVTREIGLHPALSETQAKVILLEYGVRQSDMSTACCS